jgi:hypothetical protein
MDSILCLTTTCGLLAKSVANAVLCEHIGLGVATHSWAQKTMRENCQEMRDARE